MFLELRLIINNCRIRTSIMHSLQQNHIVVCLSTVFHSKALIVIFCVCTGMHIRLGILCISVLCILLYIK